MIRSDTRIFLCHGENGDKAWFSNKENASLQQFVQLFSQLKLGLYIIKKLNIAKIYRYRKIPKISPGYSSGKPNLKVGGGKQGFFNLKPLKHLIIIF